MKYLLTKTVLAMQKGGIEHHAGDRTPKSYVLWATAARFHNKGGIHKLSPKPILSLEARPDVSITISRNCEQTTSDPPFHFPASLPRSNPKYAKAEEKNEDKFESWSSVRS